MDTLYPDSFVETGSCDGPRRTRNQLSRETPGILLEDKYISEFGPIDFNQTYRDIYMIWSKLDDNQRNRILSEFNRQQGQKQEQKQEQTQGQQMIKKVESFDNSESTSPESSLSTSETSSSVPMDTPSITTILFTLIAVLIILGVLYALLK